MNNLIDRFVVISTIIMAIAGVALIIYSFITTRNELTLRTVNELNTRQLNKKKKQIHKKREQLPNHIHA